MHLLTCYSAANKLLLIATEILFTLQGKEDPYAIPISLGIYEQLESPLDITTTTIIRRIVSNHEAYQVIWPPEYVVILSVFKDRANVKLTIKIWTRSFPTLQRSSDECLI